MEDNIKEWLFAIFIGCVLAWFIHLFLFELYTVEGDSMSPELKNNDQIIVSKVSKILGTINRGDVIVFHTKEKNDYIKRLIGKPGDKVSYKNDSLYINNQKIKEPYLSFNKKLNKYGSITENFNISDIQGSNKKVIPKNKYLVLGDNRLISNDSRGEIGLLDESKIVGKAKLRIFPLSNFKYDFYSKSFNKLNN